MPLSRRPAPRSPQAPGGPSDYTGPPQVSFAADEAKEIGLNIGDEITVNVLGRDIKATITSFREVKFERARTGLCHGDEPHGNRGRTAYLARDDLCRTRSRGRHPARPWHAPIRTSRSSASRMRSPGLPICSVAIGRAVIYGALATLLTGGIVLIGAAAASEKARVFEAAVLKTLGAPRRPILLNFALAQPDPGRCRRSGRGSCRWHRRLGRDNSGDGGALALRTRLGAACRPCRYLDHAACRAGLCRRAVAGASCTGTSQRRIGLTGP